MCTQNLTYTLKETHTKEKKWTTLADVDIVDAGFTFLEYIYEIQWTAYSINQYWMLYDFLKAEISQMFQVLKSRYMNDSDSHVISVIPGHVLSTMIQTRHDMMGNGKQKIELSAWFQVFTLYHLNPNI